MEKFSPKRQEKEVISVRIAADVLGEVDQKAVAAGISRNEFINQCIAYALSHMEGEEK